MEAVCTMQVVYTIQVAYSMQVVYTMQVMCAMQTCFKAKGLLPVYAIQKLISGCKALISDRDFRDFTVWYHGCVRWCFDTLAVCMDHPIPRPCVCVDALCAVTGVRGPERVFGHKYSYERSKVLVSAMRMYQPAWLFPVSTCVAIPSVNCAHKGFVLSSNQQVQPCVLKVFKQCSYHVTHD
eukprot:1150277-Pelagomonas_calceolata.AAC.8